MHERRHRNDTLRFPDRRHRNDGRVYLGPSRTETALIRLAVWALGAIGLIVAVVLLYRFLR